MKNLCHWVEIHSKVLSLTPLICYWIEIHSKVLSLTPLTPLTSLTPELSKNLASEVQTQLTRHLVDDLLAALAGIGVKILFGHFGSFGAICRL